jgi:hypothetical protein
VDTRPRRGGVYARFGDNLGSMGCGFSTPFILLNEIRVLRTVRETSGARGDANQRVSIVSTPFPSWGGIGSLSNFRPFKFNQLRTVRAWAPCPLVTKGSWHGDANQRVSILRIPSLLIRYGGG